MLVKFCIRVGALLIVLAATAYFLRTLATHYASMPPISLDRTTIGAMSAASGMYVCAFFMLAVGWLRLLRSCGQQTSLKTAVVVLGVSQFAKYLPGNVGHHVGRVALAKSFGIRIAVATTSMVYEWAWLVFTAATLAVAAYLNTPTMIRLGGLEGFVLDPTATAISLALAIFVCSAMLKRGVPWLSKKLQHLDPVALPGTLDLAACFALYCLYFLALGICMSIIATWVFGEPVESVLLLSGIFSCAWIIGFLTPGAPAGLGVREALLLSALTPIYGAPSALAVTLTLRLVTTLGDGVIFGSAILVKEYARISVDRRLSSR